MLLMFVSILIISESNENQALTEKHASGTIIKQQKLLTAKERLSQLCSEVCK